VVDGYDGRFLVGETSDVRFLGNGRQILHSIFNFDLTFEKELTAENVRRIYKAFRAQIPEGAWVSNTLNNHDQSRLATHFCSGEKSAERNILFAALVLFLEGLPFLYYGEEIGMKDYAVKSFDEVRDMVGGVYRELRLADGIDEAQVVTELGKMSRDRCRTPMQWDSSENAGFSPEGAATWLPVHGCYDEGVNVAAQRADENSLLHHYRRLIGLRNEHVGLQVGRFRDIDPLNEKALIFVRETAEERFLIGLNFSDGVVPFYSGMRGKVLFRTNEDAEMTVDGMARLGPFEVLVVKVV
jgi:alpha-glucosidase